MSDLEKALEPCCPNCSYNKHGDDTNLAAIVDAARRFASLTSPETIEKAAKVIYESGLPTHSFDKMGRMVPFEGSMSPNDFRKAAEAVLRSVEEDEKESNE